MRHYILNNCKYFFKRKVFYIFFAIYFFILLITLIAIGVGNKDEYNINYAKVHDLDGNLLVGKYDLKNLLFLNFNNSIMNILNIFVFVYLGFLIFIFFKETEKSLDLIVLTKTISRAQIFWSKILSILILYLPIFLVIIIPAIAGTAIDPSSNVDSFFSIWLSDFLKKLIILLFLPFFLVLLFLFKSQMGFMIFVALFLPATFVINLSLQGTKMKSITQTNNFYFVSEDGNIEKYYSYIISDNGTSKNLNQENYPEWNQNTYKYLWFLDSFGQINAISSWIKPEIIDNANNSQMRNDNQYYQINSIDKEKWASNTNGKFIGIVPTSNAPLLTGKTIDQNFKTFLANQITKIYQDNLKVDVSANWTSDDQTAFDQLITNKDDIEKSRPLKLAEIFEFKTDTTINANYLEFNGEKKYLDEISLTINYLKKTEELAPFFVIYEDLYINELEDYFSQINCKNYINWYIIFIYLALTATFFTISWFIFARKDFA